MRIKIQFDKTAIKRLMKKNNWRIENFAYHSGISYQKAKFIFKSCIEIDSQFIDTISITENKKILFTKERT